MVIERASTPAPEPSEERSTDRATRNTTERSNEPAEPAGGGPAADRLAPLRMDQFIGGRVGRLAVHIAEPVSSEPSPPSLVLCHGFPVRGREATSSGLSFPELAHRIAQTVGWRVLSLNFRGCGLSGGDFSMGGWRDDIGSAVDHLVGLGSNDVWLAGTGTGAGLCLVSAAGDPRVRGCAALAAPADFRDWARDPKTLLEHSRAVGVIRHADFPADFDSWAAELRDLEPVRGATALAPRSLLVLHGENDDLVPSIEARLIADAHGSAELRIIAGAGHELRHDPRAVAVLIGWLARQADRRLSRIVDARR